MSRYLFHLVTGGPLWRDNAKVITKAQYCDEIYVIQLFVREDFKMHLYRNLICFGNTIYSGGNIDILYLAIKMKLTEKKN